MLETPWSEASDPIRISARVDAFVGLGFDPASNPRPSAVSGDAEANLVATSMDLATGVTYSKAFGDAKRGSVLNANLAGKKDNLDFVVPASRIVKRREWQFTSNSVVVDMRGGEELAASSKRDGDPLAASGEVMLMLGDGSVQITNDIDDTFEYRMYTFADEHENAKKMGANGGMGMAAWVKAVWVAWVWEAWEWVVKGAERPVAAVQAAVAVGVAASRTCLSKS